MLILTRRPGESLMIDERTEVKVLGVNGNRVRIGIDAPQDVEVDRKEVFERKQAEKVGHLNRTAPPSSRFTAGEG